MRLAFAFVLISWHLSLAETTSPSIRPRPRPTAEELERNRLRAVTPKPRNPTRILSFKEQASTNLELTEDYKFVVPTEGSLKVQCTGSSQYFNANGTLGEKGRILKRELTSADGARSTPMKHLFFRNGFPDAKDICPKFNNFSDDEKLNFWIWYMASIALTESNCGRDAYNPNDPNGISVGELQVPEAYRNRKWRGVNEGAGGCEANPPKKSPPSYRYRTTPALFMAQLDNNLSCGVEILAGKLCGFYKAPAESCKSNTQPLAGHGFWKMLRSTRNSPIIANVKRFPLCL